MTDKFANMPPEFARFLLVALDNGKTDSERGIAIRKFTEWMTNIGSNGYELVERIEDNAGQRRRHAEGFRYWS